MGDNDLMETMMEIQIRKVLEINQKTEKFGLCLSEEEAKYLVQEKGKTLREQQRIEFGESILPKLIFTFCDSPYMDQRNYVDTILRLQEIFFSYKNELMDELTDEELLEYMKKEFDGECQGSLDYLEETILDVFARNIREEGRGFLENYEIRGKIYGDDEL